eukprot:2165230-Prymnesium_polylepis.1
MKPARRGGSRRDKGSRADSRRASHFAPFPVYAVALVEPIAMGVRWPSGPPHRTRCGANPPRASTPPSATYCPDIHPVMLAECILSKRLIPA